MHAANAHCFAPHWNAQELTDAVPLRLYQLVDFDHADDHSPRASANAPHAPRRSYNDRTPSRSLPIFSIR